MARRATRGGLGAGASGAGRRDGWQPHAGEYGRGPSGERRDRWTVLRGWGRREANVVPAAESLDVR